MSEPSSAPKRVETECLFDGHELKAASSIEITGDRIVGVTPLDGARPQASGDGAVHVPFVLPGLIDCHVHVTGYHEGMPAGAPFEPMKNFARLCALTGITTVRDTGNNVETVAYMREWSARYAGTQIVCAGSLLDRPPLTWPFSRLVRSEEEARHRVSQLSAEGVDWIKAYRRITPDLMHAIVEAAGAHGLPVAADCGATSAVEASRAGVRSLEHAMNLLEPRKDGEGERHGPAGLAQAWCEADPASPATEALIETLRDNGTYVCPTLLVSRRRCSIEEMVSDPYLDFAVAVMPYHRHFKRMRGSIGMRVGRHYFKQYMNMPQLSRQEQQEVERGLERMGEMTLALHERGVKLAAGTDAPNPSLAPGFSLHQELAYMVQVGLPTTAVLESATGTAGELLGRGDLGVIRPGARADLLCLDGDPTRDIDDLGRIERVMAGGEWVDRERLRDKLTAAIEAASQA